LARKSSHLRKHVILEGWLYQTARLTALAFIRSEIRRTRREQEACMQRTLNENESDVWTQIAPLLETAMSGLNETDRHAVVLRFIYGKSMKEVGAALGRSEGAAALRLHRAMEKLRQSFYKRGVVSTSEIIAGAISAYSVQPAPIGLAKTITAVALGNGAAASGPTLTLVKGAWKLMAWTKAKTAVVVGLAALLVVGTTATLFVKHQDQIQLQTNFPRSSWVNAGYASPEFALETLFWAQSLGDGKMCLASMTTDLQQQLQQQFGSELKEQAISLEEYFTRKSKEDVRPVTGFNIWGKEVVSNEFILRVWISGKEKDATFKMRKVGNEWKLGEQFLPDY
jgi:hypothetical protein